jgi:hypothetical protein
MSNISPKERGHLVDSLEEWIGKAKVLAEVTIDLETAQCLEYCGGFFGAILRDYLEKIEEAFAEAHPALSQFFEERGKPVGTKTHRTKDDGPARDLRPQFNRTGEKVVSRGLSCYERQPSG